MIVPDLLGYGRTDTPKDYDQYKEREIAGDVLAILDEEGVDKSFIVGHDWGCGPVSRLVDLHPHRFIAVAFLAASYAPVQQGPSNIDDTMKFFNHTFGTDAFGYWPFFASEDGYKVLNENMDSFYDILFPANPEIWKTHVAPRDKLREWVTNNQRLPESDRLPAYWDAEARRAHQDSIMGPGGFRGPTNWYKASVSGLNNDPDRDPNFKLHPDLPVFFGAALRDYVCVKAMGEGIMRRFVNPDRLTIHDFDTSHWVMAEAPQEVNNALESFFKGISGGR